MNKSKIIARYGIIIALIICAYFIDSFASRGSPIRFAVATIVVIMTISQLFDYKTAIFATTMFGLSSLMFAYFIPTASSYLFVQPHISVLPRIMIGVTSFGVYLLLQKVLHNRKNIVLNTFLPSSVAAAVGVLTNTILVLLMISVTANNDFFTSFMATVVKINFVVEFFSAIIVVPILTTAVKKRISKF